MKLSKILFESYSRQQLLNIDPMELSEDEYVDEYLQGLFAEFIHVSPFECCQVPHDERLSGVVHLDCLKGKRHNTLLRRQLVLLP